MAVFAIFAGMVAPKVTFMSRIRTLLPLLLSALSTVAVSSCSDEAVGPMAPVGGSGQPCTLGEAGNKAAQAWPTATDIMAEMKLGINIGNTLEAPNSNSGNPDDYQPWSGQKVSQAYIKGLKRLGFSAVRVPCAWHTHLSVNDDANKQWTISPGWLNTVDEVVGWIVDEGMYAVLNIHWDSGWLEEHITPTVDATLDAKQRSLWTQIATKLSRHDHHLLFAGMNEPNTNDVKREDGVAKTAPICQTIMHYSQTFVDAVRATGGNNAQRTLVVQMPETNNEWGLMDAFQMPTDPAGQGRLMVEWHWYSPYNFTLMGKDESWGNVALYWGQGNHVSGSKRNSTWGEEEYTAKAFADIKRKFVDAGYPAIVGEACTQTFPGEIQKSDDNVPYDEAKHHASRALWNETVARAASDNGMCLFYWETNGEVNRADGSWKSDCQYSLDGLLKGAGVTPPTRALRPLFAP